MFVIGHLRGSRTKKIFPITEGSGPLDELQGPIVNTITTRSGEAQSTGSYVVKNQQSTQEKVIQQVGNIVENKDTFGGNPQRGRVYDPDGIAPALSTMQGGGLEPKIVIGSTQKNAYQGDGKESPTLSSAMGTGGGHVPMIGQAIPVLTPDRAEKRQNGRRFKTNGEPMFTLTAQDKHGVMIPEATTKGYDIAEEGDSINLEQPGSATRRGRVGKSLANTLTTSCNQDTPVRAKGNMLETDEIGGIYTAATEKFFSKPLPGLSRAIKANVSDAGITDGMMIRKLTPRECWRLQGFPDWTFDRARDDGVSESQLYKQAGNSVTVNVIYEIAKRMGLEDGE